MNIGPRLIIQLLSGCFSLAFLSGVSASTTTKEWRFKVYLEDKEIGYHHFLLTQKGDSEQLSIKAKFDVSFLSIPLFKYRHENTEHWEGLCLKRIASTTNQNGKRYRLDGVKKDGVFLLVTQDDNKTLPACVSTFAYWDKSILSQKRLLNPQTGDYSEVEVHYQGKQPLPTENAVITAHHYRLTTDDADIELWYSDDDQWLSLQSTTTSGRVLRYVNE